MEMQYVQLTARVRNHSFDNKGDPIVTFYVRMEVMPTERGERTDIAEYLDTLDQDSGRYKYLSRFLIKGNKLFTRLDKSIQEEKELWKELVKQTYSIDPYGKYNTAFGFCAIEDGIDENCDKRLEGFFNDAFDYLYHNAKEVRKQLAEKRSIWTY